MYLYMRGLSLFFRFYIKLYSPLLFKLANLLICMKKEIKKNYCISLEENQVNLAKEKISDVGGKFSTLVNNLLKKFNQK